MPLPPVSTPFDYLITQIENDLVHAAELCRDIRRNRHVGHEHNQLDALENSLQDGPSFIRREHRKILDVEGADVDGGDDAVRIDFTSYVREVEEINTRLESIAHPPHHPTHRRHSSILFPSWDPPHHREVPHFHEIRLKWENVRDGIGHTFAQFIYRLELAAEKKKKEKKDKDKIEKEKKEAKEEAEEELEKEKEKAKKSSDELKKKLAKKEEEEAERLATKEKHEQAKLRHVEEIAEERDTHVERLLKSKLEEDPIDQVRRVAGVINELQHSPKHHEEDPIDQVKKLAGAMNEMNQFNNPRRHDEDPIEQVRRVAGVINELQSPKHHEEDPIDQVKKLAGAMNEMNQFNNPRRHEDDPIDQVRRVAGVMNEINQFNGPRHQEQDPIDQIHRVAGVIKDLQHTITPHHSRERIHLDLTNSASGYGTGGRAESLDSYAHPIMICDGRNHEYHENHHRPEVIYHSHNSHPPPIYWSPRSSFASSHHTSHSSHRTSPHHDPVVINNVIESGVPPGDVEEFSLDGHGHMTGWTGPEHFSSSYRHPRYAHIEAPIRRARTRSPRPIDPMPARYGDVDGYFLPRDTGHYRGW
ncbi:hypothetical protein BDZ45DRAFT_724773 [Acephala macrosclerotiorum]|nr:hypothetical protein BDZ45DRAFT_724773 [Acephala macrosclerotiorum]